MMAESCRISSPLGGFGTCVELGAASGVGAGPVAAAGVGPAESAPPPDGGVKDATCVEGDELNADAADDADPGGSAEAGVELAAAPFVVAGTAAAEGPVAFSPEDD
jgi:hypothetical protein